MPRRVGAFVTPAILILLLPVLAGAWEAPGVWSTVGEVAHWKSLDVMFYRLQDDPLFQDRSRDRLDQQAAYARTRDYTGRLDAIGLEAWRALPPAEQQTRADLAAASLRFVADFRRRIETQVQRTRQNELSGWGNEVADVTSVGDCLQRLRTAVGLDPSNPYAWHLYAWFAACVGDLARAESALVGAEQALALVPPEELPGVRRGVALDRAWLQWEQGRIAEASATVEQAAGLGADIFQVTLLRGLTAARRGDEGAALAAANALRNVAVRRFPMDYRTSGPTPELNNVSVWAAVPSDYAERWIKALVWIEAGQLDMAAKAFGTYRLSDIYPQAHRFWDDAGMIYELTGRRGMALKAWEQARITTPFAPYFPMMPRGRDVGRLTGRTGELPVHLGFDTFHVAGSRLAWAAAQVDAVEAATDETDRQDRAADALDALDLCAAAGRYPAQAALLRGAVYHRLGDLASAVIEVESAVRIMEQRRGDPGYQAVLAELAGMGGDPSTAGVQAFFGQAGASRGRWAAPLDPQAEVAAARAAYGKSGADADRRALARLLIRAGDAAAGRALVADRQPAADVELVLEADRALGDVTLAAAMAERLRLTGEDPWLDAGLWTLAGFICLDGGRQDAGLAALERALQLDPGNQGLKTQLKLMRAAP